MTDVAILPSYTGWLAQFERQTSPQEDLISAPRVRSRLRCIPIDLVECFGRDVAEFASFNVRVAFPDHFL
jgi:hypothetical protein